MFAGAHVDGALARSSRERVQHFIPRAIPRRDLVFDLVIRVIVSRHRVRVVARHRRHARQVTADALEVVKRAAERGDVLVQLHRVRLRRARARAARFDGRIARGIDARDDRRGDEERARRADRDRRLQARASTLVLRAIRRGRRRRRAGVDEGLRTPRASPTCVVSRRSVGGRARDAPNCAAASMNCDDGC